jgi:glycosyltransferase involved in cell wall biosynthesis
MKILASSPDLGLSGANVLLAKLLQGMVSAGHSGQWLVTSHDGAAESEWLKEMCLEFQSLPATRVGAVRQRQEMLVEAVRKAAPCCYFPNYDFDMLWAVGAFPADCRTAFIMHCDDPVYYQAIEQRGLVMDAIVCVSAYLASEVRRRWPELADRVHHIPFGVEIPAAETIRKPNLDEGPLEVVYCGRLAEEQKRIGDLAQIILSCHERNLPIRFHIAGSGPDEEAFFGRLEAPLNTGRVLRLGKLPHDRVADLLGRSHVFILTSAYEGLPVSLLEAMAHGCVPVVTAVKSGIPEVVDEGVNGFMLPIGDTEGFTTHLDTLVGNPSARAAMAHNARATITAGCYSLTSCTTRYIDLCDCLLRSERAAPSRRRPTLPPRYRLGHRIANALCR